MRCYEQSQNSLGILIPLLITITLTINMLRKYGIFPSLGLSLNYLIILMVISLMSLRFINIKGRPIQKENLKGYKDFKNLKHFMLQPSKNSYII